MSDRQERPSAVNLCPFVGVDLNLWPTVHIAVIELTPGDVLNESNDILKYIYLYFCMAPKPVLQINPLWIHSDLRSIDSRWSYSKPKNERVAWHRDLNLRSTCPETGTHYSLDRRARLAIDVRCSLIDRREVSVRNVARTLHWISGAVWCQLPAERHTPGVKRLRDDE